MEPAPKQKNGKYPAFYKGLPLSSTKVNANLKDQLVLCNANMVNRICCPARVLIAGPSGKFVCLITNEM
jgi:hypothetical protein